MHAHEAGTHPEGRDTHRNDDGLVGMRRDVAGQLEIPSEVGEQHGVPAPKSCSCHSCQNPFVAIETVAAAFSAEASGCIPASSCWQPGWCIGRSSAPHGRQRIDALDEGVHLDALVRGPVQEVAALQLYKSFRMQRSWMHSAKQPCQGAHTIRPATPSE